MAELKKNPSRKSCEEAIRRILMTEILEQGRNIHFRNAMDFMNYFESLYPASPGLIKQVQRAIRSMDLAKDSDGYFIIDKTKSQVAHDDEVALLLEKCKARFTPLDDYDTLFLAVEPAYKSYLLQLLEESPTFSDKYITILDTTRGFIFYTKHRHFLENHLGELMGDADDEPNDDA